MSTYVINNRIPRFPLKAHYPDRVILQKNLEDLFQVWLKEVFISNLIRRKACSQAYDFSVWMEDQGQCIENSSAEIFNAWCKMQNSKPQLAWGEFLILAHKRHPQLDWAL